ncbi:MAG: tryptophan synthase subunit alpha [Candidatus Eisenbacteria bacterium]
MTTALETALRERLHSGRRLLVPFLTAGWPDADSFLEAARACAAAGADLLEVGVPFSDPIADGPTIQRTSQEALARGETLERTLDTLAREAPGIGLPIVLMSYANPILAFGIDRFCERAPRAGVGGLLLSDVPPEELPEIEGPLAAAGIARILLIAPTTPPERVEALARRASGFLYCVTRLGVTGAGTSFSGNLGEQLARIRAVTDVPVVAGFGIRQPADLDKLPGGLDGVVLGARLLEAVADTGAGAGADTGAGAGAGGTITDRVTALLAPFRERLDLR